MLLGIKCDIKLFAAGAVSFIDSDQSGLQVEETDGFLVLCLVLTEMEVFPTFEPIYVDILTMPGTAIGT